MDNLTKIAQEFSVALKMSVDEASHALTLNRIKEIEAAADEAVDALQRLRSLMRDFTER